MLEFIIIKAFDTNYKYPFGLKILQINWIRLNLSWMMGNIYVSLREDLREDSGISICGSILRDYLSTFLETFLVKVGITTYFQAELLGIMIVIHHANTKGWNPLWLESDSAIAIQAFYNENLVSRKLLASWRNNMHIVRSFSFKILAKLYQWSFKLFFCNKLII